MTPDDAAGSVHLLIAARRAEDRADVRAAFAAAHGWTAEECGTFRAALDRCRDGGIACLLLHLDLPDAGVFEALAALIRDAVAATVPVVVLSSHLGDDFCRELVAAGADDAVGANGLRSGGLVRTVEHAIARRTAPRWDRAERREQAAGRAAADLRASEARARLALRSANLGAWEWNLATGRVVWSPECASVFGIDAAEFPGDFEAFAAYVEADDLERVRAASRACVEEGATGRTHSVEFRIRRPDGEARWLINFGSVLADGPEAGLRVVGIVGDVTERKHAETERERLLAAERAARVEADRAARLKDEFLATISHELRTPLNSILGWARLLLRPGAKPETFAEGVRVIERNAKVQAQLISDLLDVNRIVSGKLLLDLGDVDVNEIASAALETVQPAANERRLTLESALAPDLPKVRGDAARLQQVVWNLLSNAIKFTPEGGHVVVRTRDSDDDVEVEVADSGHGIAREFLPHVFDRFRQADGSTTRRHGGLGLGLAIVKQLVEMHGGTVDARSEGRDRGASFVVRLPSVRAAEVARPEAMAAPVSREALRGLRVLLVDDQADALEFTRRLLAEHGAEVCTATRAEEALALLRSPPEDGAPALLVSDIGMPGMDGYELLRAVRVDLGLGPDRLPAVAVTAYARDDDRRDAHAVGYQVHLTKPFQPDRFVAAVDALIRPGARPGR